VVATPIGNLADVSQRALDVLAAVPLVVAEDTRVTRKLFARYRITTRLESFHANSGAARLAALVAHLESGKDLALVSDAGTPLVSDPGEDLVAAWAARGGVIVPIPGPSAALAALVASGLPAARFAFEGFLPRRGKERRERLATLAQGERTTIFFEAPNRAAATLADLGAAFGAERRATLSRELTKLHEETWRGGLGDLARRAKQEPPRGEVTIVVAGREHAGDEPTMGLAEGRSEVDRLVAAGMSRSSAAKEVAARTGLARRELFREGQ
jgi:16S rRNA (cytidine1402-2'-O)-methyltransferase